MPYCNAGELSRKPRGVGRDLDAQVAREQERERSSRQHVHTFRVFNAHAEAPAAGLLTSTSDAQDVDGRGVPAAGSRAAQAETWAALP